MKRLALVLIAALATLAPAHAEDGGAHAAGWLDDALETLDLKAKPADPAPDFVRRTRPDPASLGFMQRPLAHKVSPLAVKTPAEVEAMKDALDAAHARQLQPSPPPRRLQGAQP